MKCITSHRRTRQIYTVIDVSAPFTRRGLVLTASGFACRQMSGQRQRQVSQTALNIHLYINRQENDVICGKRLNDKRFPQSFDPNAQIHVIYGKKNHLSLREQTLMQSAAGKTHLACQTHETSRSCCFTAHMTHTHKQNDLQY